MLRKTLVAVLIAIFALNVLLVVPAVAGHRIQDSGEATISLNSRGGDVPESASGTAKFKLKQSATGANRLSVTLNVKNLPKRAQRVYEVWLVDGGGSSLNLTSFNTNNDGDAKVSVTRNIVNVAPYDRIVVSEKRRDSFDTSPSGRVVLSGRLHGSSEGDDFNDGDFDDFDDDDDFNDDDFNDDDFNDDDFDDDDFNDDRHDDRDQGDRNPNETDEQRRQREEQERNRQQNP